MTFIAILFACNSQVNIRKIIIDKKCFYKNQLLNITQEQRATINHLAKLLFACSHESCHLKGKLKSV